GSPSIVLHRLRPQDRLIANELHPEALAQLKAAIGRDPRAKLLALDAFVALKSLLPPKERRGGGLIAPPLFAAGARFGGGRRPCRSAQTLCHRHLSCLVPRQGREGDQPLSCRPRQPCSGAGAAR